MADAEHEDTANAEGPPLDQLRPPGKEIFEVMPLDNRRPLRQNAITVHDAEIKKLDAAIAKDPVQLCHGQGALLSDGMKARIQDVLKGWSQEITTLIQQCQLPVRRPGQTKARLVRYLGGLAAGMSKTKAREYAGIHTRLFTWLAEMLPELGNLEAQADDMSADFAEDEAWRRAVDGWDRAVWYQGNQVGQERQFDGKLLERILKAKRPRKYADRIETESVGIQVHYHIHGIERNITPFQRGVIEAKEIRPQDTPKES